MYQRTKRINPPEQLVKEFEKDLRRGTHRYWDEDTLKAMVEHYSKKLRPNEALSVVEVALSRYKYSLHFYLTKAKLLTYLKQTDEALEVLQQAEHIAPFQPEIRMLRAEVYCAMQAFDQSLEVIRDLKANANGSDLVCFLIQESYIKEAMKDFDGMFYNLKQALEIDPDNSEALEQMWMSVEQSKRYEESVELHRALIDKNPYSYLAWYNLGHALQSLGESRKAIEALEYSFIINPDFESGYMDCAELCLQEKYYDKAFKIYEEANDYFGPDAEIIVFMVECLIRQGDFLSAKNHLLTALTLDPYNDEVHFFLGECYSAFGEWKSAIRAYNKAINIDDHQEQYFAGIANAYEKIGDLKKADHYYNKATTVVPEENSHWIKYATFHLNHGNTEMALRIMEKADDFAVGPDLQIIRAACLFKIGFASEATEVLADALTDDISLADAFLSLDPAFANDDHVQAMIRYYKEEFKPSV